MIISEEQSEKAVKTCFGVNYLKEGADPPLLPDNEYPDWLWKLLEPKQTTTDEHQEYWRKLNKKQRRQENEIRKQKKV